MLFEINRPAADFFFALCQYVQQFAWSCFLRLDCLIVFSMHGWKMSQITLSADLLLVLISAKNNNEQESESDSMLGLEFSGWW